MKRSYFALAMTLFLTLQLSATGVSARLGQPSSANRSMTVKVLSVSPTHIGTKKNRLITVHVRYAGIVMDPLHIGMKSVAGHGHMQIYLDKIPAFAYTVATKSDVVVMASTMTFNFVLQPRWRKAAHGHHRFLIALARNDYVLYRAAAAAFRLTVK